LFYSNNVFVDHVLLESLLFLGSISFITFTDVVDLPIKDHELTTKEIFCLNYLRCD